MKWPDKLRSLKDGSSHPQEHSLHCGPEFKSSHDAIIMPAWSCAEVAIKSCDLTDRLHLGLVAAGGQHINKTVLQFDITHLA